MQRNERLLCFDITDQASVDTALARVRLAYGDRIAACVHLAAYFDLTGEENPAYDAVTVDGTKRLLKGLQEFELEQFVCDPVFAFDPDADGEEAGLLKVNGALVRMALASSSEEMLTYEAGEVRITLTSEQQPKAQTPTSERHHALRDRERTACRLRRILRCAL